ncbi:Transglutaminase elicitor [Phytophthora infestans]|uniref:Transglutaminase elicitor n=1 Tax=Phytophthora infestans TaxID=4787 RepID=A0A833T119_PHYIN|nr:Transglutaminase elicitor [Phytophthora infestans]
MVKIVPCVALSVVIAAATLELAQATPLQCNAYMPTGADAFLTDDHPAVMKDYNGAVPVEYPVDQCNAAGSAESTRKLRRMEDAPGSDISDLETYFDESLEVDFTTLKEKYSSAAAPKIPWPGSYWPAYQDSINVIWRTGEKSASAKYAEAFGLDPIDFMNKISAQNGVDAHSNNTKCAADTDCASLKDGSVCAIRKDAPSGYCIPTWYGICHAWAPAAMLEDEPKCDVVKNGQTFHVMDIKALVSDIYDGSAIPTVFTGARFNGPDTPVMMDEYGRYTSAARRDLGAGFFHLAITNIMGKHEQSFIIDVTAGAQVWNQPVRSYEVQKMELVDNAQASQQYFGTSVYPFNSEMVYLAYVNTTVTWVVEAYADGPLATADRVEPYTVTDYYEYLLELDADYAVIGGEWVERSKTDHPDFLWFPTAKPDESTVTKTGLSYANVKELLESSVACGGAENTSKTASIRASESASTDGSRASNSAGDDTGNEDTSVEDSTDSDPSSSSGSAEPTVDTTDMHSTSSSSGSTIEATATSLPSLETLPIISETSPPSSSVAMYAESVVVTRTPPHIPIDTGYYTAPPILSGHDQADVLITTESTGTTTVHNSCH